MSKRDFNRRLHREFVRNFFLEQYGFLKDHGVFGFNLNQTIDQTVQPSNSLLGDHPYDESNDLLDEIISSWTLGENNES